METFKSFLAEQDISKDDINVVILTKIKSKKLELVSNRIFSVCQEKGIECHIVYTSEAWISKNDFEKGSLTVSNIDGDGKQIEFDIFKTVCFVRAGVLDNEVGLAILSTFQNAGAFMINDRDVTIRCHHILHLKEIIFQFLEQPLYQMKNLWRRHTKRLVVIFQLSSKQ